MRKIIILFVFLFLLFPILSAVEIDMHDKLNKGETLVATISGNFLKQLQKENIFFYREHVKLNVDYDLAKIDNNYYVYALLGDRNPGNYSLRIENIQYTQGTTITDEDIIKDFEITNNVSDFSANPGFVITDKPFDIEVRNLQDFKIEISINENKTEIYGFFESLFKGIQESQNKIELSSGEIKNIGFELGNETSFRFVTLMSNNTEYKIPVYVIVTRTTSGQEENQSSVNETDSGEGIPGQDEDKDEILVVSTKTCEEENGTICGEGTKCSDTPIQARDATCCLTTCEEIKENNTGKIVGWTMIGIILIAVLWFFRKKSNKAKREVNLLNIAKGKK